MNIQNRRYLGNKYKLLDFIKEVVNKECEDVESVFDVFAGTGAVASAFTNKTIFTNDILYSNYLSHIAWFLPMEYDKEKLEKLIKKYNKAKISKDNYMSKNFANTYFDLETCRKIGYIRQDIKKLYDKKEINDKENAILITSLIYAMDRIANTCGHYDAYRKGAEYNTNFKLEMLNIPDNLSENNKCFNQDSNELVKKITCDIAYLDPPYNSRQYCDAYHLLENVAKWECPEVYGVAKKMDRTNLKSDYCTNKATESFAKLIYNLNCKYILFSYNNTADKSDGRSNAKLSDEDIMKILSLKGEVKVFEKNYKAFTTGKSENNENKERIFFCKVNPKQVVSPLNYTGGKSKLLPQLKPHFPEQIDTFIDLFCGGCNVGTNVKADKYIYNDISSDLIELYKILEKTSESVFLNDVEEIIKKYELSDTSKYGYEHYGCDSSSGLGSYNKEKYIKLRNDFNKLTTKNKNYYEMFFVLIVYAFNNQIRFNNKGEFNLPVGKRDFNNTIKDKLSSFVLTLKTQNPIFTSKSFDKLDIKELTSNSFVYCDPPYLVTTASYNENGGWTEDNEKDLLTFLDKLNDKEIKFALSNVLCKGETENTILKEWLDKRKYKVIHLDYNYSNSNYHKKDTNNTTDEVLIINY